MRVTASLNHPNILPLFDSGELAGHLWFAMPYIEGESLQARLARQGQLPVDFALSVTREVADALDYAHSRGVVHRDIKPGNILLSGSHAVVADFGIACALDELQQDRLTRTGVLLGTTWYMSPERLAGERHSDPMSDLYALACVLYEMLVGEPPCKGATAQATLARRIAEVVPPIRITRPSVPAHVDYAVRRALAPIPADRFSSAAAFVNVLMSSDLAFPSRERDDPPIDMRIAPAGMQRGLFARVIRHVAFRATFVYGLLAVVFLNIADEIRPAHPILESLYIAAVIVLVAGLVVVPTGFLLKKRIERRRLEDVESRERVQSRIAQLEAERDFYRRLLEGPPRG
jgi:serine/threonine protein kinase